MTSIYEEFKSKSSDKNSVWHNFLRAQDKKTAKCKICNRILKTEGGTTSGLRAHLKSAHNEVRMADSISESITDAPAAVQSPTTSASHYSQHPPKKLRLTDYFSTSDSMEIRVSRMAAMDGIAFRVFTTSLDIKNFFKKVGYTLPKAPQCIRKIVMDYSLGVKKALVEEVQALKAKGNKFSLTFDEWTSSRNRRYINLNIHSDSFAHGSHKNLGLIRVIGALPADVCISKIADRLSEFGISLHNDVVGITTDGASVMVKVGKNISADHQLCLAHGVQLGVVDVLYKNADDYECSNHQDQEELSSEDEENYDGHGFNIERTPVRATMTLYKDIIDKTRKVVKTFTKSPTKNDVLQKYNKQERGKELALNLDCRTRWNSVATMLSRFIECKSAIQKALIDIKSELFFSDAEFAKLEEIGTTLNIVRVTAESLCRRDATLLTADSALKFMLQKLRAHNTDCSTRMLLALRNRIATRRLSLAGVLEYLNNPVGYYQHADSLDEDEDVFVRPQSEDIVEAVANLLQRLDSVNSLSTAAMPDNEIQMARQEISSNVTLEQELQSHIEKSLKPTKNRIRENVDDNEDLKNAIRLEMALYDNGGNKGANLCNAHNYLLTIPPTSVEAERAFSSAGYLCSKIRSSLKDETLDALCFLRSHFQAQIQRNG